MDWCPDGGRRGGVSMTSLSAVTWGMQHKKGENVAVEKTRVLALAGLVSEGLVV